MTDYAKSLKGMEAAAEIFSGLQAAADILRNVGDAEARQKRAEETVKSLTAKATGLAQRVAELEAVQQEEAAIRAKAHQTRQQCEGEIRAIQAQHGKDKALYQQEAETLKAEAQKHRDAAQAAQSELQALQTRIAERKAELAKLAA